MNAQRLKDPIRILMVDDSVVVRRLVVNTLAGDPDLEAIDTASNGQHALRKIAHRRPDVVVLDLEMPVMDGLDTLKAIRATDVRLPVIMFSSHTAKGATATLEALSAGASDYVTKPSRSANLEDSIESIRNELVPRVKLFANGKRPVSGIGTAGTAVNLCGQRSNSTLPLASRVDIVGIGVSTGGPNALIEIVPKFPADFPIPIMIVQHMPPLFTRSLAERLNSKSKIKVVEAKAGMPLLPGSAYIAPGGYHMVARRNHDYNLIDLNQDPPENSCRPAVDVLFRSLSDVYHEHILAAILTGMGQDGLRGCQAIHDNGGQIFAQDEFSSVIWGMPKAIVDAKLADEIVRLPAIADEIIQRVSRFR